MCYRTHRKKCRVLWCNCHRTHRSIGYCGTAVTELTGVLCRSKTEGNYPLYRSVGTLQNLSVQISLHPLVNLKNLRHRCCLHRFLWEQKVAKKVKVCKVFSQLSSCTLFMGAKSCEKSLETFTFDNNRASGAKVCKLFALQMWQKKVARRK